MLRLSYSNRIENLIEPLADAVREQQARDPLEPVTLVVPSRVMEQYIKFELAERLGVAANLRTRYLQACLAELVTRANPRIRILEKGHLELLIYNRMRALGARSGPEMDPIRRYLGRSGSPDEQGPGNGIGSRSLDFEGRALGLARETARLFLEYVFSRRRMLAGWATGESTARGVLASAESWQRRLWISLFDAHGAWRDPRGDSAPCRWMLLPNALDQMNLQASHKGNPLHLFGLPSLAPAFVGLFARLAQAHDVRLYTLNPCPEFREDVSGDRPAWPSREDRAGAALETEENPFGLGLPGENRALRLWARPAREYVRLLADAAAPEIRPLFTETGDPDPPTLLRRLQNDIRRRVPAESARTPIPMAEGDSSVRFLACPSARREVEIIAREIWDLVGGRPAGNGDGRPPIRFHEIAVLIPDAVVDAYLPHIEAVFEELHRIPLNLIHHRLARESRVAEAVDLLLRLPLGNFDRHEMLRLLTHEAVAGGHPDVDPARWRAWCERLNVVFGADREAWSRTYVRARDLFNWDQALGRLALGVFLAGEPSGKIWEFGAGDAGRVPFETGEGEIAGVARLLSLARRLLAEARGCAESPGLLLGQWADYMIALVRSTVQPAGPEDERILERCIEGISTIGEADLDPAPVPYAVAQDLASSSIRAIEAERGHYNRTGVAVGSIAALAGVPFRTIFVAGLREGVFPSRDRNDLIDLRRAGRRAGDVTPPERDRALFLQALLSAVDHVVLSFVARDAQTGEELSPSTVLHELESVLGDLAGREAIDRLTIAHPVSRYATAYFPHHDHGEASLGLHSCDPASARGARITLLRRDLRARLGNRILPDAPQAVLDLLAKASSEAIRVLGPAFDVRPDTRDAPDVRLSSDRISLSIAALRRFLECPLQAGARHALGIFEDEETEREERAEEPIAQSALQASILLREAFWAGQGDPARALDAYAELRRRAERRGEAPVGPFATRAQRSAEQALGAWHEGLAAIGLEDLSGWEALRIGTADEFAVARRPLPPLAIPIPLAGANGQERTITVLLRGMTEVLSPARDGAVRCVLRDKAKEHDYLGAFLASVIVAALDGPTPREFRLIVAVNRRKEKESARKKPGKTTRRSGVGAAVKILRMPSREEA